MISPKKIILAHIETFNSNDTDQLRVGPLLWAVGLPVLVSVALLVLGIRPVNKVPDMIGLILSIFASLLFNVLLMLYGEAKVDDQSESAPTRKKILKYLYQNTSFAILISVFTLAIVLLRVCLADEKGHVSAVMNPFVLVLDFLLYACTAIFLTTLLIIVRRASELLSKIF